jgi:hypothetical protein
MCGPHAFHFELAATDSRLSVTGTTARKEGMQIFKALYDRENGVPCPAHNTHTLRLVSNHIHVCTQYNGTGENLTVFARLREHHSLPAATT